MCVLVKPGTRDIYESWDDNCRSPIETSLWELFLLFSNNKYENGKCGTDSQTVGHVTVFTRGNENIFIPH